MSTVIRSLMVKVGADLTNMQKDFKQASKDLKNIGKDLSGAGDTLTKGLTVPIIGAVAGLSALVMKSSSTADEIQRLSDVTGLSAERLQELKYAGSNLGVELETITGAQAKLTKTMYAAQQGTKLSVDAFKSLGVNVLDSTGQLRDSKTVMEEAFTALNGVGNETERDALAMQLFGRSAMDLNPLIKAGGDELNRLATEAQNSGAIMSGGTVSALDSFGDSIDAMKMSIGGAASEVAMALLPVLNQLMPVIQTNIVPAIKSFAGAITNLIQGFSELSPGMQKFILAIIGAAVAIGPLLSAGGSLFATASKITGAFGAASKALSAGSGFMGVLSALIGPAGIALLAITAIAAIAFLVIKNWEPIKEFFTNLWAGVKRTTQGALQFFQDLPGDMYQMGKDIVMGLWNGISSLSDWIRSKVSGFVKGIGSTIKDFFGISSPSKLMFGYGEYIGQGLAGGIKASTNTVASSMAQMANGMLKPIETKGSFSSKINPEKATSIERNNTQTIIVNLDGMTIARASAKNMPKILRLETGRSV